jgi:hypothetical protein
VPQARAGLFESIKPSGMMPPISPASRASGIEAASPKSGFEIADRVAAAAHRDGRNRRGGGAYDVHGD